MSLRKLGGYVALPALGLVAYFLGLRYFSEATQGVLHTEQGGLEKGTSVLFALTACAAAGLYVRTRGVVADRYRLVYALYAALALFVALEEESWGQKLFHWNSPDWFVASNAKGETNLHNMFDNELSDQMRAAASLGFPIVCIVLPLVMTLRHGPYAEDHWAYYLLPDRELIMLACLSVLVTMLNKVPAVKHMARWHGHLGELKELVWSIMAFCHVLILRQRLLARHPALVTPIEPVAAVLVELQTERPMRKAA
jgi:hypothetical protein